MWLKNKTYFKIFFPDACPIHRGLLPLDYSRYYTELWVSHCDIYKSFCKQYYIQSLIKCCICTCIWNGTIKAKYLYSKIFHLFMTISHPGVQIISFFKKYIRPLRFFAKWPYLIGTVPISTPGKGRKWVPFISCPDFKKKKICL